VLDEGGRVLAYAEGGPANLNFVSEAVQRESFEKALEGALQGIDAPVLAFGYTVAGTRANWGWLLQRLGNPPAFPVEETRMAFVSTGRMYAHGLAVVAGTGSIISAFLHNELVRTVGGWGALLGDEGSAYDVALQGLRAAVRAWDGRSISTKLVDAARAYFRVQDLQELIPLFYQKGVLRHQLAGFARKVIQVAKQGDMVAQLILIARAEWLARDAIFCAHGLFKPNEEFTVALTGGMFRGQTPFRDGFEKRFSRSYPNARFRTPCMKPAVAVARIALRRYKQGPV